MEQGPQVCLDVSVVPEVGLLTPFFWRMGDPGRQDRKGHHGEGLSGREMQLYESTTCLMQYEPQGSSAPIYPYRRLSSSLELTV